MLHHAAGMSVPEVAESLASPIETVRSRLRLGMSQLREFVSLGPAAPVDEVFP